jgi:hypothetical protein
MSDGADTISSENDFDQLLEKYNKMLIGCRMQVTLFFFCHQVVESPLFEYYFSQSIFKVVGIGKESDTELGMRMKLATQTLRVYENTPCHYVNSCFIIKQLLIFPQSRKMSQMPSIIKELCDEIKNNILKGHSLFLAVHNHESGL